MGIINLKLSDKTELDFRKAVGERKGLKKGNLSKAVEEALRLWIKTNPH